eukprot:2245621-Lingulodinium_polyedra.AAC.1
MGRAKQTSLARGSLCRCRSGPAAAHLRVQHGHGAPDLRGAGACAPPGGMGQVDCPPGGRP